MNKVTLSEDHMTMTVANGDYKATLRSARPEGFTEDDVQVALDYDLSPAKTLVDGEVRQAWLRHAFGHPYTVSVNTGPPTWWLPRVEVTRYSVMVGWLRGLVAVKWGGR